MLLFIYFTHERSACRVVRQGKSLVRTASEIIGKSLIKIDEICERMEGRLRRLASEAKAKYEIVKGGVAYERLGYTKQLAVCELTRVCFFLTAVPNCGLNVADFWPC